MSIVSMEVFKDERAASIAALKESIQHTKDQINECESIQNECRGQIAIINQTLIELASTAEIRRKQLSALKQQKEAKEAEYLKAMAYAETVGSSENELIKRTAINELDQATKDLQTADHAYLQARHDHDQQEAREQKFKSQLNQDLALHIDTISEKDVHKRTCVEGLKVATEKLGVLLYEETAERLQRFQNDLRSKENELQSAKNALQQAITQELSKLAGYPALQQEAKSLVPFSDEISMLLDQALSLLENYLTVCEQKVPTLRKLTGENQLLRVFEGNRLTFDRIVEQIRDYDVASLQSSISDLQKVLQTYLENGVR